jgi:hypothetical protein
VAEAKLLKMADFIVRGAIFPAAVHDALPLES